jgi:CDP-diacylglycerol---glycerol-3-phosphate 3-phosphatidyltransferase
MTPINFGKSNPLANLRKRWAVLAIASVLLLLTVHLILREWWGAVEATLWLGPSTVLMGFLLWTFWQGLAENHRQGETQLLPRLGYGTVLTILRGMLVALMAGFAFSPRPEGWLAWMPGSLFSLAVLCDYLDGYLARRTNYATRLGEKLDMHLDGWGMLIASILAVRYGQVPLWYLSVGLARPLFIAGIRLRRKAGLPVHSLPEDISRRALAGVQMGFVAVILWPVFSPPGTHLAAALFALPFLIGFLKDWYSVCGAKALRAKEQNLTYASGSPPPRASFRAWFSGEGLIRWTPVPLRIAIVGLLVLSFGMGSPFAQFKVIALDVPQPAATLAGWLLIVLLQIAGGAGLALGAAGRVSALAVLISVGLIGRFASPGLTEFLLIICASALFFLGTGVYSLWKPEDRLIYKRLGEA